MIEPFLRKHKKAEIKKLPTQCKATVSIPFVLDMREYDYRAVCCRLDEGHLFHHKGGYRDDIDGIRIVHEVTWWTL